MTHRLSRLAVAMLWALNMTHALANERAWAGSPTWNQSSDSDGLHITKVSAVALPGYTSALKWQGIEWQTQRYQQNGQSLDGHGVNYTAQDVDATTGMGYNLKVGVNQGPEKSTATGDWSWNQSLNAQTHWGLFASRDWVESMGALQRGIHYDLIGGNVDYMIHPRFTLVGALAQTHFSDGQDRQQQRLRAVWDAWPDQGVTLQWAYKHQMGEKDVINPTYFNPDRLNESMGIIGWRRRLEGWQWYARLGEGRQQVNNQDSTPARMAELQLSSPINGRNFFKFRAGRSETVGLNGPGYVYRYADAQWIIQLGR